MPALATGPAVTLSPAAGPPTSKVLVAGSGFHPRIKLKLAFGGAALATPKTDASGAFSVRIEVPPDATPGEHAVTATGLPHGASASAQFLVRTNWSRFHFGPAGAGNNPYEKTIGPSSLATLAQSWTATVGVGIESSPAVAGGVLYVGSLAGRLRAFDATTLKGLWTGVTAGPVVSSPAVAGTDVYVGSNDGSVYAFPAAGCGQATCGPLWKVATGGPVISSPAVVGGKVYVGSEDGNLYALDGATGSVRWAAATGGSITSSPAVRKGLVYVGAADGLHAFSAASGAPAWTGPTGGAAFSPAVVEGAVFVVSADGSLAAFKSAGCGKASCSPSWTAPLGGPFTEPVEVPLAPAVAGGFVYAGSQAGGVLAFAAGGCGGPSCPPAWTATMGGAVLSSPAVADGLVWAGSTDGTLAAFAAAGCGQGQLACPPLWTFSTGKPVLSSPAVANGELYAASGTKLSSFHLYPFVTRSWYEPTTDIAALYSQGCTQSSGWFPGAQGVAVLDFGRLAHSKTLKSYGTYDFSRSFAPNADLLVAAESYAEGFHTCRPVGFSGRLELAIGTSNYDPGASNYHVPDFHAAGVAFANMVVALQSYLDSNGIAEIVARGADDAESAWNPGFTATHNFLTGYAATTDTVLYDFGGFSGGGWTPAQEFFVAQGAGPTRSMVEAYYQHQADEWAALDAWAVEHEGTRLEIPAITSQYPNGGYSPQAGYDVVLAALAADPATRQEALSYVTVIGWASGASPAGSEANGVVPGP
ncbi:MAG: PQQ-binding-like beta-propeller repeat protein [Actinomycetota bacterium]|nr:PQQ-binding-like beta-propeller repeat protein [Actinomycetota bacterium]